MNDKLLYFPYINIPNNNWTIKSLLYWDKIGIIVPQGFIDKPENHNEFTLDLLQTDLIESVFPYEYTSQTKGFDSEFINLIKTPSFYIERKRDDFIKRSISRIHVQKFGREIMEYLVELQIASKDRNDWDWYFVESKTANLIMVYLATVIGKIGKFTPATDQIKNLNLSISQYQYNRKIDIIRQNALEEILPFPINPDLKKLRNFKEKYHEELKSFRILFEKHVFDLSRETNPDDRQKLQEFKSAEIFDRKEKILKDLNQSKFGQIVFGGICGIAGTILGNSGALSLLNSAFSAVQGYNNSTLEKDYSYIALIEKKITTANKPSANSYNGFEQ